LFVDKGRAGNKEKVVDILVRETYQDAKEEPDTGKVAGLLRQENDKNSTSCDGESAGSWADKDSTFCDGESAGLLGCVCQGCACQGCACLCHSSVIKGINVLEPEKVSKGSSEGLQEYLFIPLL
jgi:hypothetical protein